MIRELTVADSQRILDIYRMGLNTRNATFETTVPTWKDWDVTHLPHSRFVYIENNMVLGWCALSPVSKRQAYAGVAEISVYVDTYELGKGIGSNLMEALITSSEKHGIWTLYSSVFPENKATLKLHHNFGFRIIGTREKIAKLDNQWRDTVILERRSIKVGK